MTTTTSEIRKLTDRLQAIDYDALPISDYNKQYIARLKPALGYYADIYTDCLQRGIRSVRLRPAEITMVDYGGGSGFLSFFAKCMGIGQVIYIDRNPRSAETAELLGKQTSYGPDVILRGDSNHLADWCLAERVRPQLLIATDLIEHVYRLDRLFADLTHVNPAMRMLFTTASTPFNPYVQQRLHRLMIGCERGEMERPNYYTLRRAFIARLRPDMQEKVLDEWAEHTRGLIYDDIRIALENDEMPLPNDPFNTCDPATGNWMERILPIEAYERLLRPLGLQLHIDKGYYNPYRRNPLIGWLCRGLNATIRHTGKFGYLLAPFLFLSCGKK